MCNGIPVFTVADFGEHGNSESIQALQTSLWIWHPLTSLSIAYAISTQVVLLIKLILQVRNPKIDWLRA